VKRRSNHDHKSLIAARAASLDARIRTVATGSTWG
jgi:hypothetical protein